MQIICECGNLLQVKDIARSTPLSDEITMVVSRCEACRRQGYDEGYDEGHEEGELDADEERRHG